MGIASSWFWWRKKVPVYAKNRRPILTSGEEVLAHEEGKARFQEAMDTHLPGTVFRWDKMIKMMTVDLPPTFEQDDPIRIDIDVEELKRTVKKIYEDIDSATNDRIILLRKYLPLMYDKHSVERGRRVSQQERNENKMSDECFAYGELNFEIFATMYEKVTRAFGQADSGMFFDLGCGCGQLVYTAAMLGDTKFAKCGGIEMIGALLDRGVKRMARWENVAKKHFPPGTRKCQLIWLNEDLYKATVWYDASFLFIHWTSFSNEQIESLSDLLKATKEGTHVITVTHPIAHIGEDFELMVKDSCVTSWGEADFFVYEKMSPPQKVRPVR